jgi:hypothetical protein
MSWLFSQALVEEYLGDICSDGEQSAPLSGNSTQQAFCAPDKMTAFSRLSPFGMMYRPLTEDLGEALLMSYRAGFHVRTSVPQEKAQELTANDQECGHTWRGWLAKYDHDSSLWRTAQCSLLEDLNESLATLPRSGMTRSGLLWELPMLEQTIKGIESGLLEKLPTPQATDHRNKPTSKSWKAKGGVNFSLSNPEIQMKWATPTTMDTLPPKSEKALLKEATQARPGRSKPANLRDQVSNMHKWPTPDANFGNRGTQPKWTSKRKSGQPAQYTINQAVRDKQTWPTPQASDFRDRGNMSNPSIQRRAEKGKQLNLSMVAHPTSGQLNPTWVEWLMGWPLGWTDLKPLETDRFHCAPQQHGDC